MPLDEWVKGADVLGKAEEGGNEEPDRNNRRERLLNT